MIDLPARLDQKFVRVAREHRTMSGKYIREQPTDRALVRSQIWPSPFLTIHQQLTASHPFRLLDTVLASNRNALRQNKPVPANKSRNTLS